MRLHCTPVVCEGSQSVNVEYGSKNYLPRTRSLNGHLCAEKWLLVLGIRNTKDYLLIYVAVAPFP